MVGSEIKIENVNKFFDDYQALNNVNLEIKKGEFFSLLGPSGCGKTTLLRILAGFEEPTTGKVYLDGQDLLKIPPNKRPINIVFQNYALFPHLSIYENVAFSMRISKTPESEVKDRVMKYLKLVKLESHVKKMPSQLSGGQKQRVAIARALADDPQVLLLDEPLSALDAKLRQHMLIELDNIHDEVGITFIYVTHDQGEAISVSDRVAVMNESKVVQVGTPYEIYESPASLFVANFIGETNILKGTVAEMTKEYAKIHVKDFGDIFAYADKELKEGDVVKLTIRPEKIRITSQKPNDLPDHFTIVEGKVEDLIYTGFQSKFYVKVNEKFLLRIFKQHVQYALDEKQVTWKDNVYLWWNADDSYIVEVEKN